MEGRGLCAAFQGYQPDIEERMAGVFLVIKIHCLKYVQDGCDTDRTVMLAEDYRKLFHN
jgi:hypothetical protein